MASSSSVQAPSFSPSAVCSLLLFVLLFNCCFSQSSDTAFSLRDFACAKENAGLHGGSFTLLQDNRLRVDPSQLTTNGDKAMVDALRLDAKNQSMVMSVVFPNGDESCRSFFTARVQMPKGCDVGENMTINDGNASPSHIGEICGSGKCAFLKVTCNVLRMTPVESLPNARHFTMALWKNISSADSVKCEWKAFIEDVVILLNKAGNGPEMLVEQCWQKTDISASDNMLLFIIGGGVLVVLAAIVMVVLVLMYRRERKQTSKTSSVASDEPIVLPIKKEKQEEIVVQDPDPVEETPPVGNKAESSSTGHSTVASEFGVEVPESLCSEMTDDIESGRSPPVARFKVAPVTKEKAEPAQKKKSESKKKSEQKKKKSASKKKSGQKKKKSASKKPELSDEEDSLSEESSSSDEDNLYTVNESSPGSENVPQHAKKVTEDDIYNFGT